MKKRMKTVLKEYRFDIVFMLIAVAAAFGPYTKDLLVLGSDAPFHLARIDSLKEGIATGMFPVKIHTVLCYQYGYGVGFFYPNFFLYIAAFFRLMGFTLEASYKLYAGLILLAIFGSMYTCVRIETKNRVLALLAGAMFLFSLPVMGGLYHGFMLAQVQALIFLPPAIMGMFEFSAKNEKPWMLAAGFTGLIYSHVLSTVMAVCVCLVILLCYMFRWKEWKKKIFQLLIAILAVSGITMAYWGPMLEQFASQTYRVSRPWTHVYENVVDVYRAFMDDGLGGIVTIAGIAVILYLAFRWEDARKEIKISCLIGTVLMALMTSSWFWRYPGKLFDALQFPKRLGGPAAVLFVFSFIWMLEELDLGKRQERAIASILLGVSICCGLSWVEPDMGNLGDYSNTVIYEEIAGLGAGEEWLPAETTREVMDTPLVAFSEDGEAFDGRREGKDYYFAVDGKTSSYKIPLVWYKGYVAESEGRPLSVSKNPENGLVMVSGVQELETEQMLHVWYRGTPWQKISYIISLLTAIGIALCIIGKIRKNKKGADSGK